MAKQDVVDTSESTFTVRLNPLDMTVADLKVAIVMLLAMLRAKSPTDAQRVQERDAARRLDSSVEEAEKMVRDDEGARP